MTINVPPTADQDAAFLSHVKRLERASTIIRTALQQNDHDPRAALASIIGSDDLATVYADGHSGDFNEALQQKAWEVAGKSDAK